MLVTSVIPNRIRSQYQKLDNLLYWQNLGNNINFAIFCSIIHYFLNQKNYKPIKRFLNISENSLSVDSHQIKQLIIQSLEFKNPIQHFFRNLQKLQEYIQKIEQLLDELCKIHFLMKNQKPSLDSIAIFLLFEIIFLHNNEKYGRGLEQILLLKDVDDFYFIIPLQQIKKLPLYQCIICKQTQQCININCKHQICLNCIYTQKKNYGKSFFLCICGQIILKNKFLEDVIQEIKDHQISFDYHSSMQEYYQQITKVIEQKNQYQQYQVNFQEINNLDYLDNSYQLKESVPEGYQKRFDNINYSYQRQLKSAADSYEFQGRDDKNLQKYPSQRKDNFNEEKIKSSYNQLDDIQSKYLQEQSQLFKNQQCSYCFSPLDNFNLKQDINCSKHLIGVCCVSADYRICPQCEKMNEIQYQKQLSKKKFIPEIFNMNNQSTIDFEYYDTQKIQITQKEVISTKDPTMKAFYGCSSDERQNQIQSLHQNKLPYKELS